jgi:hypothetical protein
MRSSGTSNDHQTRWSLARREDGTALVEFALVLPLLVLLTFGILEFGRAINYWIDANHLANVAARWAAVDTNPGTDGGESLQAWIHDQGDTAEMRGAEQVCIDFPDGSAEVGDPVEATVTVQFDWMPLIGDTLGVTSTQLKGTAMMRLERPPSTYDDECYSV